MKEAEKKPVKKTAKKPAKKPAEKPHQKLKLYFDVEGKLVKAKNPDGEHVEIPKGLAVYRPGDAEGDPPMPCYYIGGSWICTY